jgi:hypothetical protein
LAGAAVDFFFDFLLDFFFFFVFFFVVFLALAFAASSISLSACSQASQAALRAPAASNTQMAQPGAQEAMATAAWCMQQADVYSRLNTPGNAVLQS